MIFADKAASYQRYQGLKLAKRFDAYSYWYLSYSVDSDNVGRGRGGEDKGLAMIKAESTVIGIDSDLIFPALGVREMASKISGAEYFEIKSEFGHDGFLLESEQLIKIITPILENI